ncbi:hypothetical protein [Williamsia sterculiae]|uniref:Uncharacterized protein n=1 Tax=Williamsia sterculiae TaxID=1344003 RepID=A0A1N7GH99_9NOCA|nr:hypothetical protein [Williamsia sterculiae]SIS11899.1 hypothetical protein SAMN05445060_2779 [Williamsia sterculiae]
MKHALYLEITPESKIGIAHLWKEAMVGILEELYTSYGIGTAEGDAPSSQNERTWSSFPALAPPGSGELLMTVQEHEPPYWVMFNLRDGLLTEASFPLVLERVAERLYMEYRVQYEQRPNDVDDLPIRPFEL